MYRISVVLPDAIGPVMMFNPGERSMHRFAPCKRISFTCVFIVSVPTWRE